MPAQASLLTILAAAILPPLGVFLVRGLGGAFWLSVVLTLACWLPGAIFALAVVLRPQPALAT